MCGVLAVISKSDFQLDLHTCRQALSTMSWRGPDHIFSEVWKDRVFIGQNILALTGDTNVREKSHTKSVSGRYTIAFNGEIYNFRELAQRWLPDQIELTKKTTDTEVLVNLHDFFPATEIPDLLDGMYAYTVFDEVENVLHIARDVQGEKSLFIYEDDQIIAISSEISAIQKIVPALTLDTQSLRDYFRTRHFMLFSRTAYRDIRQILPGSLEHLKIGTNGWSKSARRKLSDWISPLRIKDNSSRSIDSLADELDALLIQVVKDMLPSSESYAAVVSGGVDSSLLAHYIVTYGQPDNLVAVNHIGKDFISSDLSDFEKILDRSIDVLQIGKAAYADEIVHCQETSKSPLHSHCLVAQAMMSAYVKSNGCKVLFVGDGGDEYFGGYDAYLKISNGSGSYSPSPYLSCDTPELNFISDDPSNIQHDLADAWSEAQQAYVSEKEPQNRIPLAMMYGDAAYQLPAVGLRSADLMSMKNSVETRCIFLSRKVATFALNLPIQARLDHGGRPNLRTKVLLKHLFLRHYPESLLVKKQGFAGFPNESADYLGDLVDYTTFDMLGIRRPASTSHLSRETLWKLANMEYFLRHGLG
ncbi:MAG: asparagine synthase-related protein [Verrucomicrobiota bacterium]|nr:asparagine synthase-related protein [Verrucomicrobiota bacterium]